MRQFTYLQFTTITKHLQKNCKKKCKPYKLTNCIYQIAQQRLNVQIVGFVEIEESELVAKLFASLNTQSSHQAIGSTPLVVIFYLNLKIINSCDNSDILFIKAGIQFTDKRSVEAEKGFFFLLQK